VATVAAVADITVSYLDEQRKLEQLQLEFRHWLQTKEDLVRLADRRDQLLAFLNAKYGYRNDASETADAVVEPMPQPARY